MRPNHRGFSLIELLIVVAIILIIAAIAIPNLMRSRVAANQASAVQSLRVISSAEITYLSTYGIGYAATLSTLGPPAAAGVATVSAAGLIDDTLAAASKSGYSFVYAPTLLDSAGHYGGYTVQANPTMPGRTGNNFYYMDESNVIRSNSTARGFV